MVDRDAGPGHPDSLEDDLGAMAGRLLRDRRWDLGLEKQDLIAAGFIGYSEAKAAGRGEPAAKRRAWFAMIDQLRQWYAVPHPRYRREFGVDNVLQSIPDEAFELMAEPEPEPEPGISIRKARARQLVAVVCTPREQEALNHLLAGLSVPQAADRMGLTLTRARHLVSGGILRIRRYCEARKAG